MFKVTGGRRCRQSCEVGAARPVRSTLRCRVEWISFDDSRTGQSASSSGLTSGIRHAAPSFPLWPHSIASNHHEHRDDRDNTGQCTRSDQWAHGPEYKAHSMSRRTSPGTSCNGQNNESCRGDDPCAGSDLKERVDLTNVGRPRGHSARQRHEPREDHRNIDRHQRQRHECSCQRARGNRRRAVNTLEHPEPKHAQGRPTTNQFDKHSAQDGWWIPASDGSEDAEHEQARSDGDPAPRSLPPTPHFSHDHMTIAAALRANRSG